MEPSDFWKNFKLGEELHISGSFIYNGIRRFHELNNLDFGDELFEFLYETSIGIERLLKIAVILYEHTNATDQEELERSLITHNHPVLLDRLRTHVDLKLDAPHNDFLNLLATFYKSHRYERFTLTSVYKSKKEAKEIQELFIKYLEADFSDAETLFGTFNNDRYRKFIRRIILKISRAVYKAIQERTGQIGLYTYELRHPSKAESVFLHEVNIEHEDLLWKELLIFFVNVKEETGYIQFLRNTPPLEFDPAMISVYLDCFKSDALKANVIGQLEHLYEEMDSEVRKERLKRMQAIGENLIFDCDDDEMENNA